VLERLAATLGLPVRYFLWDEEAPAPSPTFFRTQRSVAPITCTRADRQAKWAGDIANAFSRVVALPRVDFPSFEISDPTTLTNERIEDLAVQARRHWGLGDGPISNVVWLLENKGAIVTRCELGDPRLDGLSHWRGERPSIMLASDRSSGARSRFDAAHELGHLLLHRAVPAERLRKGQDWRLFEDQAHRFAGAFLFPQTSFRQEVLLVDLDELRLLKMRWKVSIKMMVMRAAALGLITPERARQLLINYNRRGWRLNEPEEKAIDIEQPRLLKRAIELLVQNHGPESVLERLPYSLTDIERLTGVAPHLLSQEPVVVLTPKSQQAPSMQPSQDSKLGELFKFSFKQ
jgi:Zn-dependent peptidase ImmA (M78 family)